jgi:hypothetical protein
MQRKAQGATEYLILIAIVIVIALLAVAVLKGVPSIGKSSASRGSAAFWETADIGFVAYAVDSSGITMNIRNNMKSTITITDIDLSDEDLSTTPPLPETLAPGETKQFTSDDVTCSSGVFSYDVEVAYTDAETNAEYTFDGIGNKLEGTCAS